MKTVPTYWARIFCGLRPGYKGAPAWFKDACSLCQDHCDRVGLCVNVQRTEFFYKGGWEPGIIVELINYPRFPSSPEEIRRQAIGLAARLRVDLKQNRVSVMFPEDTVMIGDGE